MTRRFRNLLYGASRAEFESSYELQESVRRLSAATERSFFAAFGHEAAVGPVSRERVRLTRVIPFFGNSFEPVFRGRFRQIGGRVVLTGYFPMSRWAKVILTIWFGGIGAWTLLTLYLFVAASMQPWWFPLTGLGVLVLGVGMLELSRWLSRNDVAWLSREIRDALEPWPRLEPAERAAHGAIPGDS